MLLGPSAHLGPNMDLRPRSTGSSLQLGLGSGMISPLKSREGKSTPHHDRSTTAPSDVACIRTYFKDELPHSLKYLHLCTAVPKRSEPQGQFVEVVLYQNPPHFGESAPLVRTENVLECALVYGVPCQLEPKHQPQC